MADKGFRSYRRDVLARDIEPPLREGMADPLEELAKLIGQSDPDRGRLQEVARTDGFEDAEPDTGWGGTAGAGGHREWTDEADNGYAEALPADGYRLQLSGASPLRDNQEQYVEEAQSYAYDYEGDDHDTGPAPSRYRGTVVILAALALAVLGTAGAFGYRVMFGGSVLPLLPPIIKPAPGPTKIVPSHGDGSDAGSSQAAQVPKGSEAELVSHQEHPIDLPPAEPAPRVVTTVPVISGTADSFPGTAPPPATVAPVPPTTQAVPFFPGSASPPPPPSAAGPSGPTPAPTTEQLSEVTSSTLPGAKEVHTFIIRPDQEGGPAPAPAVQAPVVHQPARHEAAPAREIATKQSKAAGPLTGSVGPLSIVPPNEDERAPQQRSTHTPVARLSRSQPMALASTSASPAAADGGYAVQVSSQRSEAEAQAAFRSLQAKYPEQLGGRHAIVRRADLGTKGVYYRALIGPFASAADAAGLCRRLRAAGGKCIVQRD